MEFRTASKEQLCYTGLYTCQNRSCNCEKTERIRKFMRFLNQFTSASIGTDYERQISETVATISAVRVKSSGYGI